MEKSPRLSLKERIAQYAKDHDCDEKDAAFMVLNSIKGKPKRVNAPAWKRRIRAG